MKTNSIKAWAWFDRCASIRPQKVYANPQIEGIVLRDLARAIMDNDDAEEELISRGLVQEETSSTT